MKPYVKQRPLARLRHWYGKSVMAVRERQRRKELGRRRAHDAAERALPDFLVVGVQKGGTTALFDYLCTHPAVVEPIQKETHFCYTPSQDPERDFRSFFPLRAELDTVAASNNGVAITGEATPETMFTARTLDRTCRALDAGGAAPKIIAVIRDPVARAYSQHNHNLRRRLDRETSFASAIDSEDKRSKDALARFEAQESAVFEGAVQNLTYLARGRYAEQVERLFERFGRDRVMVIQSERLFGDTHTVFANVLAFLGLTPRTIDATPRNANVYGKLDPALAERLKQKTAPWNERLYEILGERYDWGDPPAS
ncbi:MAG: sulfotransferase domain-containing protein [Planctomycetota bacterium]